MEVPEAPERPQSYDMIIDGSRVDAASGNRIEVAFPYTGQTWSTVPEGESDDVDEAVEAALDRFESDAWRSMTATERGELLFSLADEIEAHTDELARLETFANGKLLRAMRGQVESLPKWYRYYGGMADKVTGDTVPVDDERMFCFTRPEPYGVVGAITPWNSPLMLATYKIAPAIAAGNTVVLKPSEVTPVSSVRLAELALDAGFPPGALNVVTGYGEAGAALTNHEDVSKVAFTGGIETGRKVGEAAGRNINPVTLELGGKSPNIVFADADIDNAVTGAIKGVFAASGQTCVAGSRLLLQESIYEEFVERLVQRTESLTLGNPLEDGTDLAPIAFEGQYEKIQKYVEIAKNEGATVVTGGEPRDDLPGGLFYPPTILTDVTNDMRIAQEEVFGPVMAVLTFEDEGEAVSIANDTDYGLAAGIWTDDLQRATTLMDEIRAGVVWVNTYRKSAHTTPFGGFKQSGVGIEKGIDAMREYYQTKSVWINRSDEISDPFTLM